MKDPELTEEYKKQGVYFDPKLAGSANVANDLQTYVEAERQFSVKTGRLK